MERIMNEENDWDCNVEGVAVEGPVICVGREEMLQVLNELKTGRTPGHSEVSLELIAVSGAVGIQVMVEICQRPRVNWNASRMGSQYSGSNLQGEGCNQELQLL